MKASNKILHEKQYAERILEITGDTMFFVYKDGTCLDFKPNRPDFYIKEEEVVGKNIFSYFPLETARKMHKEFKKVIDGKVLSSAENYKLILGEEVKYYKCIISKFNEDHLIFQYRDITGRSVVRLKLEKKINDLREVEKAAHIGLWTFDSPEFSLTQAIPRCFVIMKKKKQLLLMNISPISIPKIRQELKIG